MDLHVLSSSDYEKLDLEYHLYVCTYACIHGCVPCLSSEHLTDLIHIQHLSVLGKEVKPSIATVCELCPPQMSHHLTSEGIRNR
jgi:hypothetical protein